MTHGTDDGERRARGEREGFRPLVSRDTQRGGSQSSALQGLIREKVTYGVKEIRSRLSVGWA